MCERTVSCTLFYSPLHRIFFKYAVDTPFYGGTFMVKLALPLDFPRSAPKGTLRLVTCSFVRAMCVCCSRAVVS